MNKYVPALAMPASQQLAADHSIFLKARKNFIKVTSLAFLFLSLLLAGKANAQVIVSPFNSGSSSSFFITFNVIFINQATGSPVAVTGLSTANFLITSTGGSWGSESVTGSTVQVAAGPGTTVTLTMINSNGLSQAVTGLPATVATYLVPTSGAPAATILAPSVTSTVSGPVSFVVGYAVPFNPFGGGGFGPPATPIVNLTPASVKVISTGTASAGTITVTNGTSTSPTVTLSSLTGVGSVGISIGPNTAYVSGSPNLYNAGAGPSAPFTVNNTSVGIKSITPAASSPTNATSVSYNAVFTQAETGVAAGNFTLSTTGTATGVISSVTGSGTSYTITVSNVSGSGSLGLNLANGTGLSPAVTNAPFTGPSYTIDNTAPALNSATFTSNNANPAAAVYGNKLALAFATSKQVQTPVVKIENSPVSATSTDNLHWSASYTLQGTEPLGRIPFSIQLTDLLGNQSATYTDQTQGLDVELKSTDASLSNITLSSGTLSPAVSPGITSGYIASVPGGTNSITITPTPNNANATMTINGLPATTPVSLTDGFNMFTILVTAQDGVTKITYTLTVVQGTALPAIASFSPVSGPVGTLVTISGTNLVGITSFTIGGATALIVNSTATTLTGFVMPGAIAGGVSLTTGQGTATGSGNFTVTPAIIPAAQQGGKLVGTGTVSTVGQGYSVAVSADGNTAILGGFLDNSQQGAAWIFTRSNGTWTQQGGKLVGTGNSGGAAQGQSVALSADGNTALVGGFLDNSGIGAAWVFTRSNGTWIQQGGKLVGTGNTGASEQGTSVSLSADGNTALVGGIQDNNNQGAAWMFTRSNGTWTQQGNKLVGTGNSGAAFQGYSASLSADGNTALVGAYADNNRQGAAWIYVRSGGTWVQQGGKLVGAGSAGAAYQGSSVSLSADGNTALVGGYNDNGQQGASWVYTRNGGAWSQQGSKLLGTGNSGAAAQGNAVSLSADGNTALVGGFSDNGGQGAVWTFTRTNGAWAQRGGKLVGTGNTGAADIGFAVALSADGTTAIAGGGNDNSDHGATWVFAAASTDATLSSLTTSAGALTPVFASATKSYTVSVPTTTSSISITPATTNANATVIVNGAAVINGSASAPLSLSFGANIITTIVTAQDGVTQQTYTLTVTRLLSADASLSSFALSSGTLAPAFSPGTTSGYSASVPSGTNSITVTTGTSNAGATVTVNGAAVTSGTASAPIPLHVGTNTITAVVTAQDGVTQETYTVIVTRPLSADASLSNLALSSGTLSPAFSAGITSGYTAMVPNATNSITVTPTTDDPAATVTVNGLPASTPVNLNTGINTVTVLVTAPDGTTQETYVVTVTVAPSPDASLSNLTLSNGTLSPAFSAGTTSGYTASVSNGTSAITVTPTSNNAGATVTVNGASPLAPVSLNVGYNIITVLVTAQDGTTTESYTLTVTRAADPNLSSLAMNVGTLTPAFDPSVTNYSVNEAYGISQVSVIVSADDANAAITVNGTTVASGSQSSPVLTPNGSGPTTLDVKVTGADNTTIKDYIITVNKLPYVNPFLKSFNTAPAITFTKTATGVSYTNFSGTVVYTVASIKITPVTVDPLATVTVNGQAATSGTAFGPISLNTGSNMVTIVVTAEDGTTTETYSLSITRKLPNNALLSSLGLQSPYEVLTASPTGPGYKNFTAIVPSKYTSVNIVPVTADPNATVTVNGAAAMSGQPYKFNLNGSTQTAMVTVTAQDGSTTNSYDINITGGSLPANTLYQPVGVEQPLDNVLLAEDGITVHQAISPNGDGINDFLQIDNITNYPENKLLIMNRNGTLVFEAKNYDNSSHVFDGHSNKNGQLQLPGTYFYSLDYTVNGVSKHKTGFLVLKY